MIPWNVAPHENQSDVTLLCSQIDHWAQTYLYPHLADDELNHYFRFETFCELGNIGVSSMNTSEAFGGSELSVANQCQILAKVAGHSVSYAITLSVSNMVQGILSQFATQEVKANYLPPLASGKMIASFALSESEAGSDAGNLTTTATARDDHYIISGKKMWITSASAAECFLVMAKTTEGISCFLVNAKNPNLTIFKTEKKMGWRSSPTCEIELNNCIVPKSHLVGELGSGLKHALNGLNKGRVAIAAIAIGVAEMALTQAVKYTKERKQFGQIIYQFQGLQWMIADLLTELCSARDLTLNAAHSLDLKSNVAPIYAAMAKLKATETAMKVCTDAIQLVGGIGVTEEYPFERYMRDAKILQIVEGTNQIQKNVIAKFLKDLT